MSFFSSMFGAGNAQQTPPNAAPTQQQPLTTEQINEQKTSSFGDKFGQFMSGMNIFKPQQSGCSGRCANCPKRGQCGGAKPRAVGMNTPASSSSAPAPTVVQGNKVVLNMDE